MAVGEKALNIVITARDLTGRAMTRLRNRLRETDTAAAKATVSLGAMVKRVVALASAALGLRAMTRAMIGMLRTGDQFERLGITMTALMGSIKGGEKATAWIKQFAQNTPLQLTEVTDAFIRLKGFGIDPMDGALQAMVDQNAKLGKGAENLTGITLALGQAWAKQKLQGEEIMQLVERGVPVWDLLAQSTGKTTAELQKMSEAGALGRDVIRDLIAAMGKQSSGAAAANMSLLSGYVSNLKDEWAQFQDAVAQAGALEFAKDTLKDLLTTIQDLKADGSLARIAQQWSDGFVSMASAIKTVIAGIPGFTGEIVLLGKAWLALKVLGWPKELRNAALGFGGLAIGAKRATIAIALLGKTLRITGVGLIIELLARLADGYLKVKTSVEENEKSQRKLASTYAKHNAISKERAAAIGLEINSLTEWKTAIRDGVVVLNEQTGAYELNQAAAEAFGFELTVQAQQMSELKQNAQALSEPYQALGNAFAEARKSGNDLGVALQTMLTTAQGLGTDGIKALALQLRTLEQTGAATKDELVNGLGAALASLSSEDRAAFTQTLTTGLEEVSAAGADAVVRLEYMQTLLEANLVAAAGAMGISVQEAMTGVDEATSEAVSNLQALTSALREAGAEGEDAATILAQGFEYVVDTLDSTEEIEAFTGELNRMASEGEISSDDLTAALEMVRQKTEQIAAEAEASGEAISGAMDEAGSAAEGAAQVGNAAAGIGAAMAGIYEGVRAEIEKLSDSSVEAFENLRAIGSLETDKPISEIDGMTLAIEESADAMSRMIDVAIGDVVGVSTWMKNLRLDAEETKIAFYEQKIQFTQLMDAWEDGSITAEDFSLRARAATDSLGLLDKQDLGALNRGIENAKRNMESLKDSTLSTLEQLRNELDQLDGNTRDIEKRKFEQRKRDLEAALAEANQTGDSEAIDQARQALQLADKIHRAKLDNIRTEDAAEKQRQNEQATAASERDKAPERQREPRAEPERQAERGQAGSYAIELRLNGKTTTIDTDDPDALLDILAQAGLMTG